MYIFRNTLAVLLVMTLASISAVADDSDGHPQDTLTIRTSSDAVHRAYEYLGFSELKSATPSAALKMAELTAVNEDDTPFLSEQIIDRQFWRVEMQITWPPPEKQALSTSEDLDSRIFEAWIDAKSGQLLKVFSEFNGHDPNILPEPHPDTAEQLMRAAGEIYHGLPDSPPEVSFWDALGQAVGSDPFRAKEILAVCVLHSHMGGDIKPVWSITGRGMTPFVFFSSRGYQRPEYMRNRRRTVVDATTGEAMFWTNSPRITRGSAK